MKLNPRVLAIVGMIAAAAAWRLVPHPPNFTPVAAIALFGGACLHSRLASLLVPLAALFVSDLVLGFYPHMAAVYAGFALTVMLGWLLAARRTPVRIAGAALASSVLFFVLTNLDIWAFTSHYPKTWAGLVECYTAALPFFRNSLLSDALFTTLLFGGLWLTERRWPALDDARTLAARPA